MDTQKEIEKTKVELRKLLSNFFQDVDNEAKFDIQTANAIVSVHLSKFQSLIQREREEAVKEFLDTFKRNFWDDMDHGVGGYISKKELMDSYLQSLKGEKNEYNSNIKFNLPDNYFYKYVFDICHN